MSDDSFDYEHPVLVELKKRVAGSAAADVTDDMVASEFIYMHPLDRAAALLATDEAAAADDGSDLRKRAQMVSLARNMRNIDRSMRKAGR